jgi:hypothetical protein
MLAFTNRINQGPACPYVKLNEAESDIYTGAGLRLVQLNENGHIVAMFNPADVPLSDAAFEDLNVSANDSLQAAMAWAEGREHLWLGECSCYDFCEPRSISLTSASDVAHLARRIGDYIRQMQE